MSASFVVTVLLWAAALAASLWILIPGIAFALNIGGLRTDILPDAGPPTLYDDDSVFGPRLKELAALGFRMESRTIERGRFNSPLHWSWESHQAQQWLVSPDGLTHATLYRLAEGEPARISMVTTFEDGGHVRTSCPGAAAKEATRPDYWRFDIRGVDAAGLLARQQEQVEAFARERGTRARAATVAEIAAADSAAEWPIVRKMARSSYTHVVFFLMATFGVLVPLHRHLASPVAPLGILLMAGLYAALRWQVLGPSMRETARLSHDHDPEELAQGFFHDPDDVADDGRILATGKYERWLRLLAMAGAVVSCAWPIAMVRAMLRAMKEQPGAIVFGMVFLALSVMTVVELVGRARGRVAFARRGKRNPASVWSSMGLCCLVFGTQLSWSKGALHHFLYAVVALSVALALIGTQLEKKRGQ